MNPADRSWTAREEALLGTLTDRALAARLKRTLTAVTAKRIKLGIAPSQPHTRTWSKAELRKLGKISDARLAARLGISRKHVLETRRRLGIAASSPANTPKKFR